MKPKKNFISRNRMRDSIVHRKSPSLFTPTDTAMLRTKPRVQGERIVLSALCMAFQKLYVPRIAFTQLKKRVDSGREVEITTRCSERAVPVA